MITHYFQPVDNRQMEAMIKELEMTYKELMHAKKVEDAARDRYVDQGACRMWRAAASRRGSLHDLRAMSLWCQVR